MLFLVKFRDIMRDMTGADPPLLETIIQKGVIHAGAAFILTTFLRCIHKGFRIFGSILLYFIVKHPKKNEPIPPIGEDRKILRESVTVIAEKIRIGEITAEEVVRTFISRIHEINGHINAVVDERFHIAIEEARIYDCLIKSGEYDIEDLRNKYPLLGIPFTVKDSFKVEGLKHTLGLYCRKDVTANEDAEVVKLLKEAGAIIIGVTNVSELCMWWESVNTIYGRSQNPYDTRHIVGGSSGGEASIQGAAGSAFGVGSDIGGSIRMPAFFCGVYGHKSTIGLISNEGHEPKVSGRIAEFLTTGPLVRHACDLSLLFNLMVNENREKLKPVPDLKSIRILWMEDDGGSPLATPISNEMKLGMRKAVQYFEKKYSLKAKRVNISKLYNSLEIWANGMSGNEVPTFCDELGLRERKVNPYWELVKFTFRASPHTLPAIILGILEKFVYMGNNLPIHKEMVNMGYALAEEIQELLGDDGILFYPSHPTSAPRHYEPLFRAGDFSYCAIFNVLGVPVTQVPLGLGSSKLPIGIQVVGGMFNDLLTIKIAQELQESFGGWVPPCNIVV